MAASAYKLSANGTTGLQSLDWFVLQRRPPKKPWLSDDTWKSEGPIAIDSLNSNCYASSTKTRGNSKADAMVLQETERKTNGIGQAGFRKELARMPDYSGWCGFRTGEVEQVKSIWLASARSNKTFHSYR